MSFLFRAALVIGLLSFFAMQRQGATPNAPALATLSDRAVSTLPAAVSALPAETRQRIAKEATSEIARRLVAMPRSEDTLGETDRRPEWRGVTDR